MSRERMSRRARWIVVGLLTTALVAAGSIAVGIAMTGSIDEITLIVDGDTNEFRFGGDSQALTTGADTCNLTEDSLDGPIMVLSATAFNRRGVLIDPAPVGLIRDGIGVNKRSSGNSRQCGRVDYLGSGRSESLTLSLGPLVAGRMISSIDFDLEANHDARLRIEFLRGSTVIDQMQTDFDDESSHGPSEHSHDKYQLKVSTPEGLFDGVRLTMLKGAVSLEGGTGWDEDHEDGDDDHDEDEHNYSYEHDDDAGDHRTVFYLAPANPEIDIEMATNGADADTPTGPYVEIGQPVVWTYTVTNPGDLPLGSVVVTDARGVTVTSPDGDTNGDGILDTSETWTYSASGTAVAGQYATSGSVSASSPYGEDVSADDPSHYFGSDPAITIDVKTNGPGESPSDGPFITSGDPVTWTYTVSNTGNVALSNISVVDDRGAIPLLDSGDGNDNGRLDTSEVWIFTAPGTAESSAIGEWFANVGEVTGTPPVGPDVMNSDGSSYFGSDPSISITVSNNGPVVVTGDDVIWDFTVQNTGNVPLMLVEVTEGGSQRCDLGDLDPDGSATCEYRTPAVGGEQTTTFRASGTDPLGEEASRTSETVGYFGGLNCGDSTTQGGPGIADDPLTGLYIGPSSKEDPDCAVAAVITASVDPGGEQVVDVAPPTGLTWVGVTGVVTIEWDAEPQGVSSIARTFRRLNGDSSTDLVIPWCAQVIPVTQASGGDVYELADPGATYPTATGAEDVCLIFQNTTTVDDGGTILTQTTEAFYVWNDPRFVRR